MTTPIPDDDAVSAGAFSRRSSWRKLPSKSRITLKGQLSPGLQSADESKGQGANRQMASVFFAVSTMVGVRSVHYLVEESSWSSPVKMEGSA